MLNTCKVTKDIEDANKFNDVNEYDQIEVPDNAKKNEDFKEAIQQNIANKKCLDRSDVSDEGLSSSSEEEESEDDWTNEEDDSDDEWIGDDYHDINNLQKKKEVVKPNDKKEKNPLLVPIVIPGAMTSEGATSDYEKIRENNIKDREEMLVKLMADFHLYKQDNGLATPRKVQRKDISLLATPVPMRGLATPKAKKVQRKKLLIPGKSAKTPLKNKTSTVQNEQKMKTPGDFGWMTPKGEWKKKLENRKKVKKNTKTPIKPKTPIKTKTPIKIKTPSKKKELCQSVQSTVDFTNVLQKLKKRRQGKGVETAKNE